MSHSHTDAPDIEASLEPSGENVTGREDPGMKDVICSPVLLSQRCIVSVDAETSVEPSGENSRWVTFRALSVAI